MVLSFDAIRRALILAGVSALLFGVAAAPSRAAGESRPETTMVDVGSHGVRIRSGSGENVNVDVSAGGIKIRAVGEDDSGGRRKRVDIRGPIIIVDDGDAGLVRVFADAHVGPGERVDGDVVAVFGSVEVEGDVEGDVVAVMGSVILKPTARVDGDVVALGGALDHQAGAEVRGEIVSLGLWSWAPSIPTLPMLIGMVLAAWLVGLMFGYFLLAIASERMRRISATAALRTGASLLLGIASAPLVVILAVLLLITVIGIPFAALLPIVYKLSVWGGSLAAAQVFGARLLRKPLESANPFGAMAVGTLFVAAFFILAAVLSGPPGMSRTAALFFSILGVLMLMGFSAVGIGAVLLSRFGEGPKAIAEPTIATPGAPVMGAGLSVQPPVAG
jgi:hypothetical protein